MRVVDYIQQVAKRFDSARLHFGHGTDNSLDEAVYLVYCTLKISFSHHDNEKSVDRELTTTEKRVLDARVRRRIDERLPVAYIVGEAWFCGFAFHADPRALIPRSPIAELIENRFSGLFDWEPAHILDMCAGGGCIGIACALTYPEVRVDLVDISEASLELARLNCERHGVLGRVHTIHSDLYSGLDGRYDLIIANPPYVSQQKMQELPLEYRHEPRLGLESEDKGLALPLAIIRGARKFLSNKGVLILEVGNNAEALQHRLKDIPLLWLEFEHGGHGVLAITNGELEQISDLF